jgi:hypothetical protein
MITVGVHLVDVSKFGPVLEVVSNRSGDAISKMVSELETQSSTSSPCSLHFWASNQHPHPPKQRRLVPNASRWPKLANGAVFTASNVTAISHATIAKAEADNVVMEDQMSCGHFLVQLS